MSLARPVLRRPTMAPRALVAGLLWAVILVAPDRALADEYLESRYPRDGFAIGLGVGPGFFVGMGEHKELLGVGFAASLRVGTTTGPRSLLLLQLDNVAYLAEDLTEKKHTNVHSTVTLAVQYYLREVLWTKAGLGVATLAERQTTGASQTLSKGFAAMGSVGYDAFHRGRFVLDFEVTLGTGIYRHGAITQLGVLLAASWY